MCKMVLTYSGMPEADIKSLGAELTKKEEPTKETVKTSSSFQTCDLCMLKEILICRSGVEARYLHH